MHPQPEHLSPDMLLTYPISQGYPLIRENTTRVRCDQPKLNITLEFKNLFNFNKVEWVDIFKVYYSAISERIVDAF